MKCGQTQFVLFAKASTRDLLRNDLILTTIKGGTAFRERERGCLTVFASVGFIYAEFPRRDTRGIIGPRSTRLIFRDGRHEDDATLHRTWQFSFVQDSHCLRRDVVSFNASITAAQRIVGLGKD